MWVYLERVDNNNVNMYVIFLCKYTCDFHPQNNIVYNST